MTMTRWAICVAMLALIGACSSGPFTIDEFRSDSGCSADGTMEILPSGEVRAVGEISYQFSSAGVPSPWCEGLTHRWMETGEVSGYSFDSDPGYPLEFRVGVDGYVYQAGSGSVTTPDGKVVALP